MVSGDPARRVKAYKTPAKTHCPGCNRGGRADMGTPKDTNTKKLVRRMKGAGSPAVKRIGLAR